MPVIKVYCDNTSVKRGVKADWGFAALVKCNGRNILFDTGGNAGVLQANLKAMGADPEHFEFIVVSHEHWDHVNGLPVVLRPGQKAFLLSAFPQKLKDSVRQAGAQLIEVTGPQEIMPGVHTTGELGKTIKEQALVVDSPKGLIIVTGCSHPGIVEIVRAAKELFKKDVFLVLGGFHLYGHSAAQVRDITGQLKSLGVKKVAPCHCTGEKAIALFQAEYGKDFLKIGAGSVIDTSTL